jgi:hypothetical protein
VNVTDNAQPTVSGLYGSDTVTGLTESFVSPNAGSEATQVNPGFTINDGNGGNNYYVADINQGTGYIFPGEPTIVVADSGGVYNGMPYAATVTINGGSTLETVSPTTFYNQFNATTSTWNTTGDIAPTNVGAYQAWVYFPGSQDWNQETTSPVSFDITPAHVTVDVAPNVTGYKMVYNGAPSITGTVTGQVPAGNPDGLAGTVTIENPVYSTSGNLAVGTYVVQAGLTGSNLNDYSVSYINSKLTVNPAALTITTASESKVYGTTETLPTPTETGLISGDNVTLTESSVGAGPTANVGVYTINGAASGSDLGDYAVTYVNGNLTVIPASFSVSIPPQVYIYGQPGPILPITITGPLGTPFQPNFIVGASPINAGVYEIPVTFNAPGGIAQPDGLPGSYNFNYQTVTAYEQITIVSAPLTITANPDSGAYGTTPPSGLNGVSYTGFMYGQNSFVLSTLPTVTTTATSVSPVGNYPITASGAVDTASPLSTFETSASPNYVISYEPGTYAVTPTTPTVSVVDKGGTYNGTTFTATATVNGLSSLEGVTPTLDYQQYINGAWTNLGTSAPVNAGSYDVTANFAGSTDYAAASSSTVDFNIGQAPLTITANNASVTYGTTPVLDGVSYQGFVDGQTSSVLTTLPTVTTTATATSPVGTYSITAAGAVDPNYAISYEPGTYTVTSAALTLTITATNESKVYGTTATLTYTAAGLVNGNKITGVTETSAGAASTTNVGSYPITISNAVGTGLSNYNINYVDGTMTVTPATLTIIATSESEVYGTTAKLTYTENGLVNGNTITSVTETSTGAVATANVGSYPITISNAVGTGLSNYTITYVNGTLTVTPATPNVVVTPYDVTYNQ